jgi:glycosyltransferase involved in cell wall biosynthesis
MPEREAVSIIIPAYNEEDSICEVIDQIETVMKSQDKSYEILVVNDGSTDKTGEVLKHVPANVIEHEFNKGYGASLKTGIKKANGDIIVITDADGTYPPEAIPSILSHMSECDMVVGARVGAKAKMPLIRKPAKWCLSKLANYLSGTKIPDLNSGLRAFRKETVMEFYHMLPRGFSFTTTITLGMHSNDYIIKYIPIDYLKRSGKSKIHPIKDTLNFILLIVSTIMYFNPLKVFLPLSFIVFILGLVLLGYDIFIIQNIGDKTVFVLSVAFLTGMLGMLADLIVKRMDRIRD